MHIVTVEKFLCCFKLETGGYFLGWLGTILTTLAIIGMATLGVVSIFAFDLIKDTLKEQSLSNSTDDVISIDGWLIKMALESQIRTSRELSSRKISKIYKYFQFSKYFWC